MKEERGFTTRLCALAWFTTTLLISQKVVASEIKLQTQSHREVWSCGKDFEWQVTPKISHQTGLLTVHLDVEQIKHKDDFCSVVGEMEFADGFSTSLDIAFADGATKQVTGSEAKFEGLLSIAEITKITAHFSIVNRQWNLVWNARNQGLDPEGPLPNGWSVAARLQPVRFPADSGPTRGTWLAPTGIGDRGQDLGGLWIEGEPGVAGPLKWFDLAGDTLIVRPALDRSEASAVLKRLNVSLRWEGTGAPPGEDGTGFYTCPRPRGTCPKLCRWSAGFLDIPPGALRLGGEWVDKEINSVECVFTRQPQSEPEEYTRFVGVSFAAVIAGKYLYMGMAPAVGNQPAQFKALVKLVTNYRGTGAANVRTTVSPSAATLTPTDHGGLSAAYDFSTRVHGRYELTFELIAADGSVFHTDRIRIDIPSVPGIGN